MCSKLSAEHGYGFDALLEEITARLEADSGSAQKMRLRTKGKENKQVNVAIIGRSNVGKSTMLNRLSGLDRAIVSDIPGTTRDAVDTVVEHGGRTYRFVDTAGNSPQGQDAISSPKK